MNMAQAHPTWDMECYKSKISEFLLPKIQGCKTTEICLEYQVIFFLKK